MTKSRLPRTWGEVRPDDRLTLRPEGRANAFTVVVRAIQPMTGDPQYARVKFERLMERRGRLKSRPLHAHNEEEMFSLDAVRAWQRNTSDDREGATRS